jgi:membrane-bound lytic murein transglycosylase F
LLIFVVAVFVWIEIQEINRKQRELTTKPSDVLQQIKTAGVLKAAVDYNSTNYFIYRGKPMGFEYEMLQALCKDLGVTLEITVCTNISDSFEGLKAGRFDLVARNITVTGERLNKVDFTVPINRVKQVLIQRVKSSDTTSAPFVSNVLELNGKTVTVQKASSHHQRLIHLANEIGGKIEIETDT